jgi:hypothetical protein
MVLRQDARKMIKDDSLPQLGLFYATTGTPVEVASQPSMVSDMSV